MIQVALLTLCICILSSVAQLPSLPQSFAADAQVTMPFVPPVPAFMYYDYPNSRQRIDMNQFGSSFITLYRYDLKAMYQISGSPGSYECEPQELDDTMNSMDIPPFATYAGSQQVNGYDCDEYQASLLGYIDLTFFVTNITTADGKMTPVLVEFGIDVAGQQTTFDLSNVVPGPQDSALFDPSLFNCQPPPPPVTYTVSGYVKSAVTTEAISGAAVFLGTQSSTTTDGNGAYSFVGVAPGTYAIKAAASGYINSLLNLNIAGDINAGTVADFNLSPTLAENQYRFVLTWGSYPTDLDSHLATPWSCNVYYGNRFCSSGSSTANLDVDDTNGFGPETVTIYTPTSSSASFTYYVYQYSSGGSLLSSNGRVQVYGSTGLLYDVHVPTSGYPASSRYWNVFTYKNGQFTIGNTLSG